MDSKKVYWLLLVVFGGVFYVMNYFTPMGGDDYAYCFYFDNFSTLVRPTPERVTSFGMAVESMWNHYHIVNGRFISHLVLQCFCALLGKPLFNVVNTLIFIAFLHVIVLLSKHRNSLFVLSVAFIVSMCLLPYPGQTMLWMAGAVNYLWPATAALWYICWLRNYVPKKEKWWKHVLVGIVCIAIGWTNESISAPIAFGLFVYFLANFKELKGLNVSAFVGYALGAALIVFSPGTFSRMGNDDATFQPLTIDQFLFIHTFNTLQQIVFTVLPLIVICVYAFKMSHYLKCPLNMLSSVYGCLFFAFLLFLWALGMDASRVYFGIAVLSFVIIFHWLYSVIVKISVKKMAIVAICLLCIVPSYYAVAATYRYSIADEKSKALVEAAPRECIIPSSQVPEMSRYCYFGGMESLGPDRYLYHNRVKAFYFGKEYIQALPDDVYKAWKNEDFSELSDVYVLPLSPNQVVKHKAQAIYKYQDDTGTLLPRQRLIRRLFGTLSTEAKKDVYFIEQGEKRYLIFPKDDHAISIEVPIMKDGQEIMIEYKPTM